LHATPSGAIMTAALNIDGAFIIPFYIQEEPHALSAMDPRFTTDSDLGSFRRG
jgi:hypothetical protein